MFNPSPAFAAINLNKSEGESPDTFLTSNFTPKSRNFLYVSTSAWSTDNTLLI